MEDIDGIRISRATVWRLGFAAAVAQRGALDDRATRGSRPDAPGSKKVAASLAQRSNRSGGNGSRTHDRLIPKIRYAWHVPQVATRVDQLPSILPQLVARIVEVLHPVQVWLFGSRARGEARADSDWDFMAILPDDAPEQDLDISSVWQRLRDLQLQRVEVFTITRSEFETWKGSLGTLEEIVASTGVVVYGG